ncbi:hypothetical protein EON80_13680, partial [bacterium]
PRSDAEVVSLAKQLWGSAPYAPSRKVGKGRVVYSAFKPLPPLQTAKWIWASGDRPAQAAPVETVYFSKSFEVDGNKKVTSAIARFAADNNYELTVNGKQFGGGYDFHIVDEVDITSLLKPGRNEVLVKASNIGDAPNPAGLVGEISVSYNAGPRQVVATGADWSVARAPGGDQEKVQELGALGMGPWGNIGGSESIYVPYGETANVLKGMGVAPDFSSVEPMRYIHRRLSDGDIYYVGNTENRSITTPATFRAAGRQPEWWNPVTGESKVLTNFKVANGLTTIPLQLANYESGFVIFRKPLPAKAVAKPVITPNFPTYRTVKTLSQPWKVAFDPKWEAPASITFPKLTDWSQNSDPAIKYYSGKAVYKTSFDAPAGLTKTGKYALSLGVVKNMASVKLNGRDLGVVWCDPWQASIPAGLLKPTGNQLEVTVANLWINRLIGDEFIPDSQRKTETTYRPYRKESPLQPSGLLGPVTIKKSS